MLKFALIWKYRERKLRNMFAFELNNVLVLKERVESIKKEELGKVLDKQKILKGKINTIEESIQGVMQNRRTLEEELDCQFIQMCHQYETTLYNQRKLVLNSMQYVEKEVKNQREALEEAVKEKKVLDQLKQKRQEEYHVYEIGKQQKTMDEMVSYRYLRGGGISII